MFDGDTEDDVIEHHQRNSGSRRYLPVLQRAIVDGADGRRQADTESWLRITGIRLAPPPDSTIPRLTASSSTPLAELAIGETS